MNIQLKVTKKKTRTEYKIKHKENPKQNKVF